MTNLIKVKRSTTGGNVPATLSDGEVAINLVDKRIFTANSTTIFDALQNTVSNVAISNSTGYFKCGNSTVNSFQNSTSFALTVNSTVNFVIAAPAAADYAAATKVLLANGSFGTPTATAAPGGANTNIQFNDSGSTNGDANLSWNKTTATISTVNEVITGNLTANGDYISVGNSTVNAVLNSTALTMGPSSIGGTSSTNGYSIMPNGLILQWGFGVATTGAGGTFTFPLPFPTAVFSVQVSAQGKALANDTFVNVVSTSSFTVVTSTASTNCYYMAIGK